MPVTPLHRNIVERLFHAMQMGPAGESEMLALFADNAVFIEPFSGTPRTHQGLAAIRQSFRDQWKHPLPDLKLIVDRIDLDALNVRAEWTCTSAVFSTPMRGYDLFTLNSDGKIERLEIVVTEAPPMGPGA